MNDRDELLPYLIGGGAGVVVFALVTPIISVPPSFRSFAIRSIALVLVAAALGFVLADRYLDGTR